MLTLKETRVSIKNKTMKYIEKAIENNQSIPLSEQLYLDGIGEFASKTLSKEGNEYVLYHMRKMTSGDFERKKVSKLEALTLIDKYLSSFSKVRLNEELEYWKECELFLQEVNENSFIDSYISNIS